MEPKINLFFFIEKSCLCKVMIYNDPSSTELICYEKKNIEKQTKKQTKWMKTIIKTWTWSYNNVTSSVLLLKLLLSKFTIAFITKQIALYHVCISIKVVGILPQVLLILFPWVRYWDRIFNFLSRQCRGFKVRSHERTLLHYGIRLFVTQFWNSRRWILKFAMSVN